MGVTFGPLNGPHSTLHTLVVAAAGSEMLSVDWLVSYAIVRYCARSLRLLPSQLPSPLLRLPLVCPYASLVVERVTEFVSPGFGLPIGSVACGWAGVTAQSSSAQRMHRERSVFLSVVVAQTPLGVVMFSPSLSLVPFPFTFERSSTSHHLRLAPSTAASPPTSAVASHSACMQCIR